MSADVTDQAEKVREAVDELVVQALVAGVGGSSAVIAPYKAVVYAEVDSLVAELSSLKDALERERKARKAVEELNAEEVVLARENWKARVESLEAELADARAASRVSLGETP